MKPKLTLREKRRRSSRRSFIEAATKLFDTNGFRETTMAQVADEAELHLQTLYSHFPTKQALATAIGNERFRSAFERRESDTLSFWRSWVIDSSNRVLQEGEGKFLERVSHGHGDPILASANAMNGLSYTAILARGIANDLDVDFDDANESYLPVLIANMLWGGNSEVIRRWSNSEGTIDLVELHKQVLDEIMAIVECVIQNKYPHFKK